MQFKERSILLGVFLMLVCVAQVHSFSPNTYFTNGLADAREGEDEETKNNGYAVAQAAYPAVKQNAAQKLIEKHRKQGYKWEKPKTGQGVDLKGDSLSDKIRNLGTDYFQPAKDAIAKSNNQDAQKAWNENIAKDATIE